MFDLINGLPIHPLVVHAVVVLVPLAALGTIAIALRPAWRSTFGPLVVVAGILSVILCPIATSSGETLQKRVGDPGEHAALGDQLVWFVIPVAVLALALVLLERRRTPARPTNDGGGTVDDTGSSTTSGSRAPVALKVVAVLAVIAALATGVQVYRVGDSGAKAVWGDRVSASSGGSGAASGSSD